jgi:hypothetical protein
MWHVWERGRKVYKLVVGKPKGNRPFGRPRENKIKMDLREIGWGGGLDATGSG